MTKNVLIQALKTLILDLIGEILYFPIWWYSQGLKNTSLYVWKSIKNANRNLGVSLMFKSLFKPMFGQSDREGRFISFFIRLFLLLTRLVIFIFVVIFNFLMIIFWLLLPVAVLWGITTNFSVLWKV